MNGLEVSDELLINTVRQLATNTNADRSQSTCRHCEKRWNYRLQCPLLNKKEHVKGTQTNLGNKNSGAYYPIPNNNNNNIKNIKNKIRTERKPKIVYPCCETYGKRKDSSRRCCGWANAANRPLPWKSKPEGQSGHHQQDAQNSITGCVRATAQHLN